MEIIKYDDLISIPDINIKYVNNLVTNNEKIIMVKDSYYFSIYLPELNYKNNGNSGRNTIYEEGLDYSNVLEIVLPNMYMYMIVFIIDKKKYIVIDNPEKISFIKPDDKILNIFIKIIDKCEKDYLIIDSILYNIKKKVTFIEFYSSYTLIEYIDKLLFYSSSYNNIIKDMIIVISRIAIDIDYEKDKNKDYAKFKNRITIFQNNINNIIDNLERTRHGTMQRISYLDSGTARILTIVAAIFLPTTFFITLLSMPFKGVPFRNSNGGYYIVISIITIMFFILGLIFYKDFENIFKKQ